MNRPATQWAVTCPRQVQSIDEVIDTLLANRGVDRTFLSSRLEDLQEHAEGIRNLDAAAERVAHHLQAGHRMLLVGDYDCDGLTSVAQIVLFLRSLGHTNYLARTPANRAEGYGLPLEVVRANPDVHLLVALDCGSFDVEAVAMARDQGAEVVVIDHHAVPDTALLAPATVLVNPKHPACPSRFKEFATAGLVLLFLSRLRRCLEPVTGSRPVLNGDYLALAAVGTVADMMPLVSGNRALVRRGLELLSRGSGAPLQALRQVAGLAGRAVTAGQISFQIAPRLNAAARVGDAAAALSLLLSEDEREMMQLARALDQLNRRRQDDVEALFVGLQQELAALPEQRTVVLAHENYPVGVNGILAQRIVRAVHRPAVVLQAFPQEGIAIGSARSIPEFDLYGAIHGCAGLLERWGGHAMAAGLTVRLEQLDAFRARFEAIAAGMDAEIFVPRERADLELPFQLISAELLDALQALEPHGMGNPAPRFALRDRAITSLRIFGREGGQKHLELGLGDGITAVFWNGAKDFTLRQGDRIDLVCSLERNALWGGAQAVVRDLGVNLLAGAH